MRTLLTLLTLLGAGAAVASAQGVNLRKVERTITKEPAYKSKPKYCLLVFGQEAKHRVWVVLDGDVVYIDRNGQRRPDRRGRAARGESLLGIARGRGQGTARCRHRRRHRALGRTVPARKSHSL